MVERINQKLSDRALQEEGPTEVLINREMVPVIKKLVFGFNELVTALAVSAGVAISAGTSQASSGTVAFADSNGISFGLNGQTMTASHNGLTIQSVQPGIQSIFGGTTRVTTGELVFSNSNGVSCGVNGQTITASVAGGGGVAISGGTQLATSGTVVFSNSNGITFGLSGSSVMTARTTVLPSRARSLAYRACRPGQPGSPRVRWF